MIGKPYFLLSLLQAVVSEEWRVSTPPSVIAQWGLCVRIPCRFSYPSGQASELHAGLWLKSGNPKSIAFHSTDLSQVLPRFRQRTQLSGDLKDGDCSLIIKNITQEDEGEYSFEIEFKKKNRSNSVPTLHLYVSAVVLEEWSVDIPRDVTARRGSSVRIPCRYSYPSRLGNEPRTGLWMKDECLDRLTVLHSKDRNQVSARFRNRTRLSGDLRDGNWSLVVNNIAQEDAGSYYFKIEFENQVQHSYLPGLMIRVSAEQGLQKIIIVSSSAAVGTVLLVLLAVTCILLKPQWKSNRLSEVMSRTKSKDKFGTVPMRERQKQEDHYKMYNAPSATAQEKARNYPEATLNRQVDHVPCIYENMAFDESSIYANV